MILAIDVGNTKTKAALIDEKLEILAYKVRSTPDLFEPERWKDFFDSLYEQNEFSIQAELRISCVSWRAFLALRVYLQYDSMDSFDPQKPFNSDLLILPVGAPLVLDSYIPLNRGLIQGMVGTDRLLAAYAAHKIFSCTLHLACLGTATTIDIVTEEGMFYSGVVMPGLDAAYSGLIDRAISLPSLTDLPETEHFINNDMGSALYAGVFLSHALLIESIFVRQRKELTLPKDTLIVLTGGRAFGVSAHFKKEHSIVENLTLFGLALIPHWIESKIPLDIQNHLHNINIVQKREDRGTVS